MRRLGLLRMRLPLACCRCRCCCRLGRGAAPNPAAARWHCRRAPARGAWPWAACWWTRQARASCSRWAAAAAAAAAAAGGTPHPRRPCAHPCPYPCPFASPLPLPPPPPPPAPQLKCERCALWLDRLLVLDSWEVASGEAPLAKASAPVNFTSPGYHSLAVTFESSALERAALALQWAPCGGDAASASAGLDSTLFWQPERAVTGWVGAAVGLGLGGTAVAPGLGAGRVLRHLPAAAGAQARALLPRAPRAGGRHAVRRVGRPPGQPHRAARLQAAAARLPRRPARGVGPLPDGGHLPAGAAAAGPGGRAPARARRLLRALLGLQHAAAGRAVSRARGRRRARLGGRQRGARRRRGAPGGLPACPLPA